MDPYIDKNLNYVAPMAVIDVQTKYDHENDTDDIPDGLNPTGFVQMKNKNKKLGKSSLLQMDAIPHEDDTDDIDANQA